MPDSELRARLTDPSAGVARLGETFCREVADHFDGQPSLPGSARGGWGADLDRRYALLRAETRRQFDLVEQAGIRVAPWLGAGQPYRDSRQLRAGLRDTGILYVFLSRAGHGPDAALTALSHPLRIGSGVVRDGVEFEYNDLLRAVHDYFGHALFGNDMSLAGELRAAYCNLVTYPDDARPVLFTEQVGQVCWFFCGPHLRSAGDRLPARGEPGWLPPARRPFPQQKVFGCPPSFLRRFLASFEEVAA